MLKRSKTNTPIHIELYTYIIIAIGTFCWCFLHFPYGVMDIFMTGWTAVVFATPLSYIPVYSIPIRVCVFLCWVPLGLFVQVIVPQYHSYGIGILLFAIMWFIGWQLETNSYDKEWVLGTVMGGLILFVGVFVVTGQIKDFQQVWYFQHIEPTHVRQIQFRREADNALYMINEPGLVQQIVTSFPQTYSYMGRGGRFGKDPWTVTLFFQDRSYLTFRIGKGTRSRSNIVWIKFTTNPANYHDYQNQPLYHIITQKLPVNIWGRE